MEAVGMILIAALAYGLSFEPGGLSAAVPGLGALALGAQRLLPALQQGYSAWASLVGNQALLSDTIDLLEQPLPEQIGRPPPQPMVFNSAIRLCAVRFRYTPEGPWVLNGVDLTIPHGARIGIVGSTGSGKSTSLDILMGLLAPTEGELRVDSQ